MFFNITGIKNNDYFIKAFFNEFERKDIFLNHMPHLLNYEGIGFDGASCMFPKENEVSEYYPIFEGVVVGDWTRDGYVVVTEKEFFSVYIEACYKFIEKYPVHTERVKLLINEAQKFVDPSKYDPNLKANIKIEKLSNNKNEYLILFFTEFIRSGYNFLFAAEYILKNAGTDLGEIRCKFSQQEDNFIGVKIIYKYFDEVIFSRKEFFENYVFFCYKYIEMNPQYKDKVEVFIAKAKEIIKNEKD